MPGAQPQPGALVQSAAMAALLPPKPTYQPNLPAETIKQGLLSLPQIESVVYAGQAHSERLEGLAGEKPLRKGFFIGDALKLVLDLYQQDGNAQADDDFEQGFGGPEAQQAPAAKPGTPPQRY